ncbi:hypothetical protein BC628DRAFT_1360056 [Trametes gibbosa]|nr:hypothetical protein BC628DRAFT_1360056 [Trametes gibbosa]
MPPSSCALLFLATLSFSVCAGVLAVPSTNATCQDAYKWMNNARGQSPCLVSAYLLSPCSANATGTFIPALQDSHSFYNFAGTVLESTPCVCNTVTYSMLYACATCQGAELSILPWYIAAENCTNGKIFIEKYPTSMPTDTSVPFWAYQSDVQITGHLDIYAAMNEATSLYEPPDATVSGFYEQNSSTPTFRGVAPGSQGQHNKPSTGVIVGAAVGGTVGAAIIGIAIIFLVRAVRRRRHAMLGRPDVPPKDCGGMYNHSIGQDSAAILYNPDNPATYPFLEKARYGAPLTSQATSKGASQVIYPGCPEL